MLLILVGLLGLLAAASNPGSILDGIHSWLFGSFGQSWFVPDALAFGVGAYLLWPNAPRPRPLDLRLERALVPLARRADKSAI